MVTTAFKRSKNEDRFAVPLKTIEPGTVTIEIKNLEYGYNPKNPVIKGINLTFDKPEFVCIMGPNGVGKSTLIHCINKILKPTRGEVLLNGKNVEEMKLKEVASLLGYVPASARDAFPLTVVDTIMVGLQNDNSLKTSTEDLLKVNRVLKMMNIEHLAMRNFDELSAGQHQKVVLARGLVRNPPCVLLDEPTSNLDIKHQIQVTKALSELPKKNKMLVIMISHDINISAKFAERIVLLDDGKVFADGTPDKVLTRDNIRKVYNVDAQIVNVEGKPHVVLMDALDDND